MQRGFSRRQKNVSRLLRDRRDQEKARLEWEKRRLGQTKFGKPKET